MQSLDENSTLCYERCLSLYCSIQLIIVKQKELSFVVHIRDDSKIMISYFYFFYCTASVRPSPQTTLSTAITYYTQSQASDPCALPLALDILDYRIDHNSKANDDWLSQSPTGFPSLLRLSISLQ